MNARALKGWRWAVTVVVFSFSLCAAQWPYSALSQDAAARKKIASIDRQLRAIQDEMELIRYSRKEGHYMKQRYDQFEKECKRIDNEVKRRKKLLDDEKKKFTLPGVGYTGERIKQHYQIPYNAAVKALTKCWVDRISKDTWLTELGIREHDAFSNKGKKVWDRVYGSAGYTTTSTRRKYKNMMSAFHDLGKDRDRLLALRRNLSTRRR